MAQAKRKKKFFEVDLPLIKKTTQVQAFEVKELDGRFIKYDLTRSLKGKNTLLQLKIVADDKQATTKPYAINLLPYYLKKMIRKGTNYIEDSFSVKCKDAQVRVKPFLITRRKVSRAVRKALRNKAREELTQYLRTRTAESFFQDILKNIIQKKLGLTLKKIYPLSLSEIRVFKVENEIEQKNEEPQETKKEKIEEKVEDVVEESLEDEGIPEKVAEEEAEDIAEDVTKDVTKR